MPFENFSTSTGEVIRGKYRPAPAPAPLTHTHKHIVGGWARSSKESKTASTSFIDSLNFGFYTREDWSVCSFFAFFVSIIPRILPASATWYSGVPLFFCRNKSHVVVSNGTGHESEAHTVNSKRACLFFHLAYPLRLVIVTAMLVLMISQWDNQQQ